MKSYGLLLGLLFLATSVRATEPLTFDAVEHLSLGDAVIVTLEEAEVTRIEVSGSDEAMEKLEAKSQGGELVLKNTRKFWHFFSSDKAREYSVKVPRGILRRLSLSGSTQLEAAQLTSTALRLDVSGAGNLQLDTLMIDSLELFLTGSAKLTIERLADPITDLQAEVSGASRLQLPAIDATDIRVQASGSSHVSITAVSAEVFDVHLSGATKLGVKEPGQVHRQRLELSGASDYRADELLVQQVQVSASGGSNIRLHATETLNANLSGGSTMRYAGKPRAHINSSGGSHAEAL